MDSHQVSAPLATSQQVFGRDSSPANGHQDEIPYCFTRVTKIYTNCSNSHLSDDKAVTSYMLYISNVQDVIMRFYLVNATKHRGCGVGLVWLGVGLLSYT